MRRLRTLDWKAAITAAGCIFGIFLWTLLNLCKYLRRVSPSFCWRSSRSLGLPGSWWPPVKAPMNWWHRSAHDEMEFFGRCMRSDVGLESQREVVGEHLLVSSPGSLNSDGVDTQKHYRVQPPAVLLRYLWLERVNGRPTELPQLSCKGRGADLER